MTPWIQTASGKQFHYDSENPDEVCLEDIAVALSRMPRFAGHTTQFYSVAQHSVLVSRIVAQKGGTQREQLIGLLHDATEAYMCDLPRPLKYMFPGFVELEKAVWQKIATHFFGECVEIPPIVKEADNAMLAAEARDLLADPLEDWVLPTTPATTVVPYNMGLSQRLFISEYRKVTWAEPAIK